MKRIIPIALGSLSLVLTGCTTARIADYQPPAATTSERTAQASGVVVALDPFVEKVRTEQYFDMDAVGRGIAILHVRVTNRTADQTFLVKKENFQLLRGETPSGNLAGNGQHGAASNKTANTIAWAGVVAYGALTPAAMLTASAMVSHSDEIQRNLTSKEMGDQTLSPGESMEGFMYFAPVNKGEDWSRETAVKLKLIETKSDQTIELNVPLSH